MTTRYLTHRGLVLAIGPDTEDPRQEAIRFGGAVLGRVCPTSGDGAMVVETADGTDAKVLHVNNDLRAVEHLFIMLDKQAIAEAASVGQLPRGAGFWEVTR